MPRASLWPEIEGPWDVLIIGGGITGAGILRLASLAGLKALLVEQHDFSSGTSSRSSKLVHGGLRYLRQGHFRVTRQSVAERERLIREAPGLVYPLDFLLPVYQGQGGRRAAYRLGLYLYDLLAGRKTRFSLSRREFACRVPALGSAGLEGGLGYQDALADDARLVLRLIFESLAAGGRAINYACAKTLLFDSSGSVCGAVIADQASGATAEARARVVINAAGAWVDQIRGRLGRPPVIRPLRGSHLVFPHRALPVNQGITFPHPRDRRPVFVLPWEGVTLVGTTDLDQRSGLAADPVISAGERDYLLSALEAYFPDLRPAAQNIMATFCGIRPVVGGGHRNPSRETRDMLILDERGLLTVTGGKLTTFRLLALKALAAAGKRLNLDAADLAAKAVYTPPGASLLPGTGTEEGRLYGRYGPAARQLVEEAGAAEMRPIPGSPYLWAELKYAARHEMACHLDDLLLRRLRLGLLLPGGGAGLLDSLKEVILPAMGWDQHRWQAECARYLEIWNRSYSPTGKGDHSR